MDDNFMTFFDNRAFDQANRENDISESSSPQLGFLRVPPLRAVPELLRESGVSVLPLLQSCGIEDEAIFQDPEALLPFAVVGGLLNTCAKVTAQPHFGLMVGARAKEDSLGAVGLLLQNAPDVISALKELVANIDVQQHGSTICLKIEDQTVILGYEVYVSGVRGVEQIYDCAVAIGWNIMRSLCGSGWLPVEVQLRRKQPIDIKHYHCFFQAPMKFNSGQSCLVFSRKWLDRPLELASPTLRKHVLARIQEVRSHSEPSFLEQTYKVIVMLLSQKRCSREQLAWHLSLHPRALSRRLADSGTSFRELQRAACHEMARQLLRGTRLSIPAIGALLGYSDGTAFSRSFSKWEGVSPASWRKRLAISH